MSDMKSKASLIAFAKQGAPPDPSARDEPKLSFTITREEHVVIISLLIGIAVVLTVLSLFV
jgi:hypothetical protein